MTPSSNAADPWIPRPFVEGRRYRVRHDFKALRDSFKAGEILIYQRCAWSRYDGLIGYFFAMPDTDGVRAWDIPDDQNIEIWRDHFEEVSGSGLSDL